MTRRPPPWSPPPPAALARGYPTTQSQLLSGLGWGKEPETGPRSGWRKELWEQGNQVEKKVGRGQNTNMHSERAPAVPRPYGGQGWEFQTRGAAEGACVGFQNALPAGGGKRIRKRTGSQKFSSYRSSAPIGPVFIKKRKNGWGQMDFFLFERR